MERFFDRFAALSPAELTRGAFASIGADLGMDVLGPPLRETTATETGSSLTS
jgi:hypothetical protein